MYNKDNNSKRSNSSSKNESERSQSSSKKNLDFQNQEELNKISNRSESGSDKINDDANILSDRNEGENEKIEENYNETNRTNETLPENPNFFNKLCSNSSSKKKTYEPITEVDEDKDALIKALTDYFDSEDFQQCLEGIETKTKTKAKFIEKYNQYIDRFENSNNYDESKKIDTKEKLGSKILNYFKELIKGSDKYNKFKKDIMSKYNSIYKNDDDEVNFSFNENDNDVSQIEFSKNNTNMSENILTLDLSQLDNETTNRNQINEENKEDENKKSVEKMHEKEGYGEIADNYYKQIKDQVAKKVNEYFKSKSNENKNDRLNNEYHKKSSEIFDSMEDNVEFVQSKGNMVEEGFNDYNPEINQNVLTNTQLNNEEADDDYSGYNCPQYTGYAGVAAIGVYMVVQALNYMLSDHHEYHGFGPSGF